MYRTVLLMLAFLAAVLSPSAFAIPGLTWLTPPAGQIAGPYSSWFPAGQTGWVVTPAVTTSAASGGAVTVVANGVARASTATGAVLDIPGAITVRVPGAAVATSAARAVSIARSLAGPVGAAVTAWQIYDAVKKSGVQTCPPPDFFCKPSDDDVKPAEVIGGWAAKPSLPGPYDTAKEVCAAAAKRSNYAPIGSPFCSGGFCQATYVKFDPADPAKANCMLKQYAEDGRVFSDSSFVSVASSSATSCPSGSHLRFEDLSCVSDFPKMVPVPEPELAGKVGGDIASDPTGGKAKTYFDAVTQANGNISAAGGVPVPGTSMLPPGSPTTVSAPPVTSPTTTFSRRDYKDANGVPQTETVQQQHTITPQAQGSGTSTNIVYNITTTTITTTTNNTVNNTNNPPTVVVNKEDAQQNPTALPMPVDLPTDYNREATQSSVLQELRKLNGDITAKAPTGEQDLENVKAANDRGMQEVGNITEGSLGLKSWLPSIPTAKCVDPKVANPLTGSQLAVPICDSVDVFASFISAVISVFALYGCVREVQSAMKA